MIAYWLYYWAPYLIIAAIVLFIAYRAYTKRIREKDQLKNIALHLGLTFSDQPVNHEAEDDPIIASPASANGNPVRTFIRTISGWQMNGRINGVNTKIYGQKVSSGHKHSIEYTFIDALATWHSNSSFLVTRETSMSRFGKAVFGMQDIQSGNEQLDKRVVIKGVPEHFIKRILRDDGLQRELLELFEIEGSIHVDQQGAHFQKPGAIVDEKLYRKLLDHLTRTASALERASGTP